MESSPLLGDSADQTRPEPVAYSSSPTSAAPIARLSPFTAPLLKPLRLTAIITATLINISLGFSIWALIAILNTSANDYTTAIYSIPTLVFTSIAFLLVPLILSASYVTLNGKRPYLIFTAITTLFFAAYGIAAAVFAWMWVAELPSALQGTAVCGLNAAFITLAFISMTVWSILALRFHTVNPLPAAGPAPIYAFPARQLRICSIPSLVLCVVCVCLEAFTNSIIPMIWAPLALFWSISAVTNSFVRPNRVFSLINGISALLMFIFGLASFSFNIIFGANYFNTVAVNSSMAALTAVQLAFMFTFMIYCFYWFNKSKNYSEAQIVGGDPAPEALLLGEQQVRANPNQYFPDVALKVLSSFALVFGLALVVTCAFTRDVAGIIFAPVAFVASINLVVASSLRPPNRIYLLISSLLALCMLALSPAIMATSILVNAWSYYTYEAAGISMCVLVAIWFCFVLPWVIIALRWFSLTENAPAHVPPMHLLRVFSLFCLVLSTGILVGSSLIVHVLTIVFGAINLFASINMTISSFLRPNKIYLLLNGIFSCILVAYGLAVFGIDVNNSVLINYFSPLGTYFVSMSVLTFLICPIQLAWTILALRWVNNADDNNNTNNNRNGYDNYGAVAQGPGPAGGPDDLPATIRVLSAAMQNLTSRIEDLTAQNQQLRMQQQQQSYQAAPAQ